MVTPGPCVHRPHPTRLRRATFSRRGREKERAAKLDALEAAMAAGDLPQNVNFAVKSAIVATFLDANRLIYKVGATGAKAMDPAEIADTAQAMSGFVVCR